MDLNNWGLRLAKRANIALLYFASAIVAWLAIEAWFNPLQFIVFAGDDLRTFDAAQKGFIAVSKLMTSVDRFRPVVAFVDSAIAGWTRCDFREVASIGLAIHAANAMIFFFVLYRVIKLPFHLSAGVTVIAILNRFATYLFIQEQAIMEGLGIATLLALLAVSLLFIERPTIRRSFLLSLFFLLIIHIHERYLVLTCPLIFIGICGLSSSRRSGVVLTGGITVSALVNLGVKKLWLGTGILMGAGNRKIGFDASQICSFLWHGALNLIGINRGPAYLGLEDFPDSPLWVQIVSVATALLSCFLLAGVIYNVVSRRSSQAAKLDLIQLVFYLLTTAVLLLSASITFRQEYRWLYPAYLAFLALLGWGTVKVQRLWSNITLTCLILLSIPREIYLSRWHPRFFAFQATQVANNFFRATQYASDLHQKDAILIRGEVPARKWVFMENRLSGGYTFSKFYALPNLEFEDRSSAAEVTDEARLVLEYDAASGSFKIPQAQQLLDVEFHRMNYSVLEAAAAALPPNSRLSTPTKTPVFLMPKNGINCMIAVAPVDIRVPVPHPGSVLHVCFSHMYAMGDGADLEIAAVGPAGTKRLLSRVVPPLTNNDFPVWRKYEFALPVDAEQVDLHVFSKTNPLGDWIAVRDFSFN
jgi:hypothetical protein